MVTRWQYWLLILVAASALVLGVINAILFVENRGIQAEVNNRQQFVQQSIQLEVLYREMAKALADLSARDNDEQLRSLLKAHGITFTMNPSGPSNPPRGSRK